MINILKKIKETVFFCFRSKHNFFEVCLIWWFFISLFLCLQDQGSAFFIFFEEVINSLSIFIIYKTLIEEDNGNIGYITIQFFLFVWFSWALFNDGSRNDISFWRQLLYVASDVSMMTFTFTNFICGLFLWIAKVRSNDNVSRTMLVRLSPFYGYR